MIVLKNFVNFACPRGLSRLFLINFDMAFVEYTTLDDVEHILKFLASLYVPEKSYDCFPEVHSCFKGSLNVLPRKYMLTL